MANLKSSAPGILEALLKLIEANAGSAQVFPFELEEYEPAAYVLLDGIENHEYEWEAIGGYWQRERYDVAGRATIFSGSSPANTPGLALQVMSETYALFESAVMGPVVSNRTYPFLGTTGPSPQIMLPGHTRYSAGKAAMAGGPSGWFGLIEWAFHFEYVAGPA